MKGGKLDDPDGALLKLLRLLGSRGYRFVTPTPLTHARIVARRSPPSAASLRDVLGWSLPFARDLLDEEVMRLLTEAGVIDDTRDGLRSVVRISSLQDRLFVHSAYPTASADSVFFGPDSYRFADLVMREIGADARTGLRIVDIGTGAGVGAILAACLKPHSQVTMTDINPEALRLARVNALAAGALVEAREGPGLAGISEPIDVAMINPPYIVDCAERTYRDGGGMRGAELSLELAEEALAALAPGGRLVLYTGSAIVDGIDQLKGEMAERAERLGYAMRYWEIDPDVFGEELDKPQYEEVERIAVVAAVVTRPA